MAASRRGSRTRTPRDASTTPSFSSFVRQRESVSGRIPSNRATTCLRTAFGRSARNRACASAKRATRERQSPCRQLTSSRCWRDSVRSRSSTTRAALLSGPTHCERASPPMPQIFTRERARTSKGDGSLWSASVQRSEAGPRRDRSSSEPRGLTAERATNPSFTKYTVRGRSPWAQIVAPDSRLVGVRRQRPWEAIPSEQALQSVTGALESTRPPRGPSGLTCVCLHELGPRRCGGLPGRSCSGCALAAIKTDRAQGLRKLPQEGAAMERLLSIRDEVVHAVAPVQAEDVPLAAMLGRYLAADALARVQSPSHT